MSKLNIDKHTAEEILNLFDDWGLFDDLEKEVSKEYPQYKAGYIAGVRDFLDIFHLTESKVRDIAKGKAK